MITFPAELTATKYPGYYWNTQTKKLFSIKIGGELRELGLTRPNRFNKLNEPAYRVSVKGIRKNLSLTYLGKLEIKNSKIPYA